MCEALMAAKSFKNENIQYSFKPISQQHLVVIHLSITFTALTIKYN